jgi:hypothetical protein
MKEERKEGLYEGRKERKDCMKEGLHEGRKERL